MDKGGWKGNYLKSTCSSIYVYVIKKAVRKGYLPDFYKDYAKKAYDGILKHFITVDDNGLVNLNQCCLTAGLGRLGDNPFYRNGTFEYYVSTEIRSNDPKGTGPFILASLEFEKPKKRCLGTCF